MNEIIAYLIQLQSIDNSGYEQQNEKEEMNSTISRYQEIQKKMKAELDKRKIELEETVKLLKEQEHELKIAREKEATAKIKLGAASKTKAYLAAQKEYESMRKFHQQREETLLKLMEEMEMNKEAVRGIEDKFKNLTHEIEVEEKYMAKRMEEINSTLNQVEKKKVSIFEQLPKTLVARYSRIKQARDGVAVVPSIDGTCTGCQRHLPPQLFNIIMKQETLESCPNCSRFLFYQKQKKETEENNS